MRGLPGSDVSVTQQLADRIELFDILTESVRQMFMDFLSQRLHPGYV